MRREIKKMDTISNEIKFLCKNKIKNTQELFLYKKQAIDKLNEMLKERAKLRRIKQKEENIEEKKKVYDNILNLSNSIFELKREVGYCEDIEERSQKMKENIKELEENEENQKGKEKVKDEFIRFSRRTY